MPDTKLNKLKELLKIASEGLTREEFITAFKAVLEQIKNLERDLISKVDNKTGEAETKLAELQKLHKEAVKKIEEENKLGLSNLKKWAIQKAEELFVKSRINEKIKEVDAKLADIRDGIDGQDADEERIYQKLKAEIPEEIKETPESMRDKLETLEDDEKLSIQAIQDLPKILEELKNNRRPVFGGGGFSAIAMLQHFVDDETPINNSGDNLNFTINHAPSPATSLKLYRGGQRLKIVEDYTFSGRTITLLIPLATGEILLADYMI